MWFNCISIAPVAQLDRVTGFEPVGREFESLRARHKLESPPCVGFSVCMVMRTPDLGRAV
jgi:hypothetical protein